MLFDMIFVQVFCNEASQRIALNLGALKNSTQLSNFKSMAEISKNDANLRLRVV